MYVPTYGLLQVADKMSKANVESQNVEIVKGRIAEYRMAKHRIGSLNIHELPKYR